MRTPPKAASCLHVFEEISPMNFSTEAIVAGAIAIVFAVLSMGVIAQEQGEREAGPTNSPAIRQMAAQGFDSSSSRAHRGSGNEVLGLY
jgi:hypothetical protein